MDYITSSFPITSEEYQELETKFGNLAEYQAWQLVKRNTRNNHTDDQQDISQEVRIAMLKAGSYYKRQTYIEDCLELCKTYVTSKGKVVLVKELDYLWKNKTKHGANRQKFGAIHETLLDKLTNKYVPKNLKPSKTAKLKMDQKFIRYCKAITWNTIKAMGKKITKEKAIRSGAVSLSEYDHIGFLVED